MDTPQLVTLLVIGLLSTYLGVVIHEGTHYITARAFTQDVSIGFSHYVLPDHISFEFPDRVSDTTLRLTGIAPLVISLGGLALLQPLAPPASITHLLLTTTFVAVGGGFFLSGPDVLAVISPENYREQAKEQYRMSNWDSIRRLKSLL